MLTPNTRIKTATYNAIYSPMETKAVKEERKERPCSYQYKNPNVRRELFPIQSIKNESN